MLASSKRRICSQKNNANQTFDPISKYEGPVSDVIGSKERLLGVLNEAGIWSRGTPPELTKLQALESDQISCGLDQQDFF
jgi:hypothetical protein